MAEWYDNIKNMRGYENINNTGTRAWPEFDPNYGKSFQGIGRFDVNKLMRPEMLDPTGQMGASNYVAPPIAEGNYQGTQFHPSQGNIPYAPREKKGILERILNNSMMGKVVSGFRDSPEEAFGKKYFNINEGGMRVAGNPMGNLYSGMNVSSMFGRGLDKAGQKRLDTIQNTITNFPEQWSKLREDDEAKYKQKLAVHEARLAKFKQNQTDYQAARANDGQVIEPVNAGATTDGATTGGATYYDGAKDFNRAQAVKAGGYKGHSATAGRAAAGPMSGSYGVWGKRDGGRIGYQGGELVGQETDFIEGPQGGEEFQETVVEGQEQPSREQLEALAMEIFQLPLEQLDEQQLLVVYQEAMQGQPMEEDFQEEDVQFAAQGGRMGYENGELVTDESMMEATPEGMMQENVEEVQGEPTREELEALAMEIFQLPLEELDEKQLMIVYQAAMQQEPMQEDIQEEDVQYAANGGLASLL